MRVVALAVFLTGLVASVGAISIDDFGAQPNNNTAEAARANGLALWQAVQHANTLPNADKVVVVPADAVYTVLPYAVMEGLHGVTIAVEGTIDAWPGDIGLWPNNTDGRALHLIDVRKSTDVTLGGGGLIRGFGYRWWWHVILTGHDNRPHLVWFESCINAALLNLRLENSPMYHVYWQDALGGLVQNITVRVDVTEQKALLAKFGKLDLETGLPTFPLNTDGLDIAGKDVVIRGNNIENFDDALCAKPMSNAGNLTKCTSGLVFEDSEITWGVGASVGSVPPRPEVNCIRNTTFRNIRFHHPIKAIYVKPNPPLNAVEANGTGIIDDILYENIYIEDCAWWTIWVSTQQQKQPGNGTNTGCSFFYPLPGTTCPLDWRVPVTNLRLRNVTAVRSLMSPGVLRCSPEGPCTGWEWSDVNVQSLTDFPAGKTFLCEGLVGAQFNNVNVPCNGTDQSSA